LQEAEELEIEVMETRERVLGHKHPSTLTSMFDLASTYKAQGGIDAAIELIQEVESLRSCVLGEDHPETQWLYRYLDEMEKRSRSADLIF
jgi:hypothetical protein